MSTPSADSSTSTSAKQIADLVVEAYHAIRSPGSKIRTMSVYAESYFRDRLMPDDPADLWTQGPDIGRAAHWWRRTALRKL